MNKSYCVIGSPIGHSLSPILHNEFFRRHGVVAVYTAIESDDAKRAASEIRSKNIFGASITIPNKISIMAELDDIDALAMKIGAVNTIVNENGTLKGFNTDVGGAMDALKEKVVVKGKRVLILGAGGVARAIGFGAKTEGADVIISNRTEEKGRKLAAELDCEFISTVDAFNSKTHVIVNATSIGMWPEVDGTPVSMKHLADCVVFDTVYNPLKTRLLREAGENGCTTVSGLRMFVHQARLQFELWTGIYPDPDEMERFLLDSGRLK